jgi:hypothetical protein
MKMPGWLGRCSRRFREAIVTLLGRCQASIARIAKFLFRSYNAGFGVGGGGSYKDLRNGKCMVPDCLQSYRG